MRTKKHYEKMLSENHNASIGFTLAADMVYAAINGTCDVADHIEQSWRDIARSLKTKYGENLSVDEVRAEMIKRPAAAVLGSIRTPKKSASSRENGKKGGRPTEKKTYWILSGEGENGTWEKHIATLTGIKRIATKERCGGDRWARIWKEVAETETTKAHIYDIDNGDMRDVPDED